MFAEYSLFLSLVTHPIVQQVDVGTFLLQQPSGHNYKEKFSAGMPINYEMPVVLHTSCEKESCLVLFLVLFRELCTLLFHS